MPLSSVVGAQSIVKPGVCTSSTRPASPYVGQCIYETDTLLAKVWTGSAWEDYPAGKANTASPTFTGTVVLPSTTSIGNVTSTEIGYVDGVTSAIQTQLDSKLTATTATTSNRNAVINGAMNVWQRGTSFTSMGAYTADRWYAEGGASRTVTRQVTGDTTNLPNIQYCLRYQRNSGNTSTAVMVISQSMETVNSIRFAGKTVTYSFYARKGANYSGASNALTAYLVSGTGTDQNQRSGYTTQTLPIQQNATLTTTWQRFSFTATVSTAATELAVLLEYVPVGTAGVNDYFEATGFQLEQGAVATPFEHEDYGTTLAKCQRYYESGQSASFYQMVVNGTWVPWTERLVHYKVPKRSTGAVSVTVTGSDNAAAGNGTVPSSNVDSFTHRQTVNNGSFPYCAYSLVYTVNSEL
jgi:hypothetical protein